MKDGENTYQSNCFNNVFYLSPKIIQILKEKIEKKLKILLRYFNYLCFYKKNKYRSRQPVPRSFYTKRAI